MDIAKLVATYKNGSRVRERPRAGIARGLRIGTIEGTALANRVSGGVGRPILEVHVKWDDGTESTAYHTAFEVI